ncbi:uncharacterized protein LOC109432581 [Aedes albopictus]|uniref:Ashwin n=1 Tax=Aedes albopictus TaxID=7160 RepID=A0ABM1ZVV7_AEDAL|nr:uncharacterized protein LOC109432581 [Aedes albopictus]
MDILHPHLLSKQQLLEIFRQRHISIPRLEESSRDELISLYSKYLLPLPRRGGGSSSSNATDCSSNHAQQQQDVEMADASSSRNGDHHRSKAGSNVRNRIVYSDSPVDNVSHGMKRIRLINTGGGNVVANSSGPKPVTTTVVKRTLEISPNRKSGSVGNVVSPAPSKRQKITWP